MSAVDAARGEPVSSIPGGTVLPKARDRSDLTLPVPVRPGAVLILQSS
jgi:hypothetical protein